MSGIIVFDVETTGKDQGTDQIVEISIKKGITPQDKCQTWRIRPLIAITPGAQELHKISLEDLAEEKTFKQLGKKIRKILDEAKVWVGYNLDFDINIVQAELKRNGFDEIDLSEKTILDPYKLWQAKEPRKLENAYSYFVGKELKGGHAADIDTDATAEVLIAMLNKYELVQTDFSEIALICAPERAKWIGHSRHFQWNDDGLPIIAFGNKHGGKLIKDLAKEAPGYLKWIVNTDFPMHVKDIAYEAANSTYDEFVEWLVDTYGPPPKIEKE